MASSSFHIFFSPWQIKYRATKRKFDPETYMLKDNTLTTFTDRKVQNHAVMVVTINSRTPWTRTRSEKLYHNIEMSHSWNSNEINFPFAYEACNPRIPRILRHTSYLHKDPLSIVNSGLHVGAAWARVRITVQLNIFLTQFKRQVTRNACTKGANQLIPVLFVTLCCLALVLLWRGVNFGLCSITHPRQRRRLGSAIELCMRRPTAAAQFAACRVSPKAVR